MEFHLLIACTASVATIKLPLLIQEFQQRCSNTPLSLQIRVILTENAKYFLRDNPVPEYVEILTDHDEWSLWNQRGDPILHIDLTKWAHVCLISPLSANTLAKIANGMCDNLLTCLVRAWPIKEKPLFFCPAMNTVMWRHPVTNSQIETLQSWNYQLIPCVEKTLMCGDTGFGAMAEVQTIVQTVLKSVKI